MLVVFKAMSKETGTVLDSDVLHRFRLQLFAHARELGNVSAACRTFGVHRSTYYRWRAMVERSGKRYTDVPSWMRSVVAAANESNDIASPSGTWNAR